MTTRKIQFVAGSTYSISLPKQWVLRNHFKPKSELNILENADGTLSISPQTSPFRQETNTINIEDYRDSIEQAIFSLYYMGVEEIIIRTSTSFIKQERVRIRQQLEKMSGAEITYEDSKQITIRVLIDKSKINIHQLIYRTSLILDSSMDSLSKNPSMEEIMLNENEIDRLFHLNMKIIHLSITDSRILQSSGIKNRILIPSYLLICKKLENIGDNLYSLFTRVQVNPKAFFERKIILSHLANELTRTIRHILSSKKFEMKQKQSLQQEISSIQDPLSRTQTEMILKSIIDIQEEMINIKFYTAIHALDVYAI